MPIQILNKEVVEKIAAGEVLERPANLVKELLENSLDAGATEIEIDLEDGGRTVQIKDNGIGISPDELHLALSRHATSKLQTEEDLWRLTSFGFRGEALASVSAVSRLTLTSRQKDRDLATRVVSEFGELSELAEVGAPVGTTVHVTSLFENVPARLKFLKSDSAETAQINKVIKAIALSSPETTIRVRNRGKLVSFWPGKSERSERAQNVLGVKTLFAATGVRDNVRVEVAFSSPTDVQKTSQDIWLFVQGRWVQDRTMQAAVMEAYRNLLMHGEYPTVVVWLEMSTEDVDVNVHPAKSQVKFQKNAEIFRAVHHTLRNALEQAPWRPKAETEFPSVPYGQVVTPEQSTLDLGVSAQITQFQKRDVGRTYETGAPKLDPQFSGEAPRFVEETSSARKFWENLQVLGQANLTYIIAQSAQGLYLVDQHAAHERVLFEQIMGDFRSQGMEIQPYLMPLTVDLTEEQVDALFSVEADLNELGLSIDRLSGESLAVRAAPSLLKEKAIVKVLFQVADEVISKGGSFALERKLGDIIATMACHSAIRAGDPLSQQQMEILLKEMDEHPLSGYCPHGRPVYVEQLFKHIDRSFGRIV